jgi:hypothetical protein
LAQALAARYQDFLAEGEAQFTVQVKAGVPVGSRSVDPALTGCFKEGVFCFDHPSMKGEIDDRQDQGKLWVASDFKIESIEYYLRVVYALLAFRMGGIMMHAAGILRNGKAYLFFGHSGAGKTTVARLSSQDVVLNDDLIILLPEDGVWQAYGTPFWNPTQVRPSPRHAPLIGLYRLVQSKKVCLETLPASQALAELVANTPVLPEDPLRGGELMLRLAALLKEIPAFRLFFLPDDTFWRLIA